MKMSTVTVHQWNQIRVQLTPEASHKVVTASTWKLVRDSVADFLGYEESDLLSYQVVDLDVLVMRPAVFDDTERRMLAERMKRLYPWAMFLFYGFSATTHLTTARAVGDSAL